MELFDLLQDCDQAKVW